MVKNISSVEPTAVVDVKRVQKKRTSFTLADVSVAIASFVLLFILVCALVPSVIAPYEPTFMDTDHILEAPSATHFFGTDHYGKDVFSSVVYGSRDALIIGLSAVAIGLGVGSLIGAISGYIGGWLDTTIMRLNEIVMTIPGILLALAIAAVLGPSVRNLVLAIAIASIPSYVRVMRAQMLTIKKRQFIQASTAIGTHPFKILIWHVVPNALSPLLVMGTIGLGTAILSGAGLSFLGLGVVKEIPDWGALLSQGRSYLTIAWWIATFPGLAITAFVLSVNILGDKFQELTNPKLKKENR